MKKFGTLILIVGGLFLTGCAHQIQLNPKMTGFEQSPQKVAQSVGYYISDTNRNKKVTTPGGGGDKVSYTPYKDIESVLFTVLSNKFNDVYVVKSLEDQRFIQENDISFVFIPEITTGSSSDSMFTWPPTKFMFTLACKAIDSSGTVVWEGHVYTEGLAEFDEFKEDFSLSARRATEKAFMQFAKDIENVEAFNKP